MKVRPDLVAAIEGNTEEANAAMHNVAPLDAFKIHGDNLWQQGNHGGKAASLTTPDPRASAPYDAVTNRPKVRP